MCDKCNNTISPCDCNEPKFCGCQTNLDLLCTFYSGETLETLGITDGMNGTEVISKINDYVKNILLNLDISPTVIENVGNGVEVHKGLSSSFINEFKTLLGIEGIKITAEEDRVKFEVDTDWLETTIIQVIEDNQINSNLDLRWSSAVTPGNPITNPENWHSPSNINDIWMAIQTEDSLGEGVWNIVKTKGEQGIQGPPGPPGQSTQGTTGQSTLSANVFQRAATQPTTPTGGTYLAPTPSGWSDGIPPANGNAAWMSTRIFTSDGLAPQQNVWSTPSLVADSASIDYEFSSFTGTSPGTPSQPLNGATWHDVGTENDIWMAFRAVNNGVYGVWSVVRVKGEQGEPGVAGSGFNIVSSNPMQSVAVGSDSITSSPLSYLVSISVYNNATQLFSTNSGTLEDDQFRIELPSSPQAGITVIKENSSTLRYNIASGTTLPDTSITSLIDVTVGSSNTVLKTSFVIIPIKTAEDSTSLSLNLDSNVVKFDAFGNLVTPTSITASAVQQNYTETITWSSVPIGLVTGTGTMKVLDTSELFQGGNTSVKVKVTTPNGLSDETTILKVQDGAGGAPGINGTTGPSPRLLELVNGGEYENGQDFIDYAYYRTNDANEGWYTVKVVGGVRTVVTYSGGVPDVSPTGPWVKTPFQKEMSFGTVIAEQANLAGFKFRNETLNSQTGSETASCHPTPGVQLPNLSLDGRQGIVKFLDRMVMDKNGIALKDDCGRPRMVFQWNSTTGIPILKFLDENGVTTWEAGQSGYQVVFMDTIAPYYTPMSALYKATAPNGSISEFNAYFISPNNTCQINNQATPTGNMIYYDQPGPAPADVLGYQFNKGVNPTYTPEQNSANGKYFTTQDIAGALVPNGFYMKNFYATIINDEFGTPKDVVKAQWTQIIDGIEREPIEVVYDANMTMPICTPEQQTQWEAGF